MPRVFVIVALLAVAATSHAAPQAPIARPDLVRAHHEKVIGAALLGVGSALTIVGQILFVMAATTPEASHAHCGTAGCGPPPALNVDYVMLGAPFVAAGGALAVAGTAVYIVGSRRKERVTRATLSIAPQLGPMSTSLIARLRFQSSR